MSAPTVGLALIARDEEEQLPHLLRSIAGAFNQVVLLDTGSTDRTVEVFEKWAERERLPLGYEVDRFEWCDDFAAARNAADAMLDTDWLAWADCDDEIVGAERLREIAEAMSSAISWVKFQYVSAELPYLRERLFRRGCGHWCDPVHEYKDHGPTWCCEVLPTVARWQHRRGSRRKTSNRRNRRITRAWVEAEPENARALYLAARQELVFDGDQEHGIAYARSYLRLREVRRELGPHGLARAHWMLERLPLGGDVVQFIAFGLVDPYEWRDRGIAVAARKAGAPTRDEVEGESSDPLLTWVRPNG